MPLPKNKKPSVKGAPAKEYRPAPKAKKARPPTANWLKVAYMDLS